MGVAATLLELSEWTLTNRFFGNSFTRHLQGSLNLIY